MTKKIKIIITEILSRVIQIKADSIDDAICKAEKMYTKEDIVLDWSDFNGNVIINRKEDNICRLIDSLMKYMLDDEKKHYEESNKPENHIYLTLLQLQRYI